ncbi:MAG: YbaK/EbsC family protein [Halobacteriales archaeon]
MHPRATEFRARARTEVDFEPAVRELPEGTHTAADAAGAIGCELGQIVKSMVMDVDGELVIALTSGPNRVDEAALAERVGVGPDAVAPADPDHVKATLGWSIGGVPPFAHDHPVETLIDPDLLEHDEVWAGAGTPSAVFPIDPQTLREITGAELADVFREG